MVIGEHVKIDPFSRITCDDGEFVNDVSLVGPDGNGRLWSAVEEMDEDEFEDIYVTVAQAESALGLIAKRNSIGSVEYEDDVAKRWKDWKDVGSSASEVQNGDGELRDSVFESEISRMITDSYSEGLNIDNLDLEIGCFKRAENMTWDETLSACLPAILKLVDLSNKNDQKVF